MSRIRLEAHGLEVVLQGDAEQAIQTLYDVLVHLGASAAGTGPVDGCVGFRVDVAPGRRPTEFGRPLHLDVRVWRGGDGLHLECGAGAAVLSAGTATVQLDEDRLPLHFATYIWANLLRARGYYVLHAGGVVADGRGVLVIGPSGSGKSTLTLGLLRSGLRLLSDDSVVLAKGRAHAMRRGLFLEPAAARRTYPDLEGSWSPCPLVEASKQRLDLASVFGTVQEDDAVPALLVFPRVGEGGPTTVEAMPPEAALHVLVEQSRLVELDEEVVEAHLEALGQLASTPAVAVTLGPDVLDDAAPLVQHLLTHAGAGAGDVGGTVIRHDDTLHVSLFDGTGALLHLPSMSYVGLDVSASWMYARLHESEDLIDDLVRMHALERSEAADIVASFVNDLGELAP